MEIKDIIKSLVQQCNIESISTKDMAKELGQLYTQVETLEQEKKRLQESFINMSKERDNLTNQLREYKVSHVEPVETLKFKKAEFDKEKYKFEVEREYMKREVEIYKEIVRSLTASHTPSEYYNSGNGSNWSKNMVTDKPGLPGAVSIKIGD